jgi:hypothetical protein
MNFTWLVVSLAGALFLGLLAAQEIGRRLGIRHRQQASKDVAEGGVVDGAVFGLLGLLIAFTFSGAAARFEDRSKLVAEEANTIGTAYLRLNLLPPDTQPDLRDYFRRYLDSRLAFYSVLPDIDRAKSELEVSTKLQNQIWTKSIAAAAGSQPATMLLLPSLNEMFDIVTTRTAAALRHPPEIIFVMLCILALFGGVLAGYAVAGKERSRVHTIVFALTLSGAVYVILDIEYPRLGFIRLDHADRVLVELRESMN